MAEGVVVSVEVSGMFFSPGADNVFDAYIYRAESAIADEAERHIHILQKQDYMNPTGYYERHIVNQMSGGHHLIHDSDVIYGAWLEGVGSRNFPVTRFRGYSTFRRTAQTIQSRAVSIAQPHIKELCRVMNK